MAEEQLQKFIHGQTDNIGAGAFHCAHQKSACSLNGIGSSFIQRFLALGISLEHLARKGAEMNAGADVFADFEVTERSLESIAGDNGMSFAVEEFKKIQGFAVILWLA